MDVKTALVLIALVVTILGLFYWRTTQQLRRSRKIDELIIDQAALQGLAIENFRYAGMSDWKDSPFPDKIRVGSFGLYGIPAKEEYVRIVDCRTSHRGKRFWVKVVKNKKMALNVSGEKFRC